MNILSAIKLIDQRFDSIDILDKITFKNFSNMQ